MYKSEFYCECGCRKHAWYETEEERNKADKGFSGRLPSDRYGDKRIHISCKDVKAPEEYVWMAYSEHWGTWVIPPQPPAWETL